MKEKNIFVEMKCGKEKVFLFNKFILEKERKKLKRAISLRALVSRRNRLCFEINIFFQFQI